MSKAVQFTILTWFTHIFKAVAILYLGGIITFKPILPKSTTSHCLSSLSL